MVALAEQQSQASCREARFYRNGTHMGTALCLESLEAMGHCREGSFDMIYMDPPFFTNRAIFRNGAAYNDRWESIEEYVRWLSERFTAARKLLRDTGTIFVHMDWHAVHYAKVLLDEIFGYSNFLNEIIWYYRTGGVSKRHLSRKHDNILVYAKSGRHHFYRIMEKSYVKYRYGFSNTDIRFDGRGYYTMVNCRDVWDIPALRGNHPEYLGFPTQKPLALAQRIVACSTRKGNLVGDFFCGSGTLALAAAMNGRRVFAFDSSPSAFKLTSKRLSGVCDRMSVF